MATDPAPRAYLDGLKLLARRELSVAGLRARLADREHAPEDIDAAVDRLLETRALDDRRVARAHARTALAVKGRGRLRVARELHALGIEKDIAAEAVADVFGDTDERALIDKALQKKLRGRPRIASTAEHARLYQYLMRQGFTPAGVVAALRTRGDRTDSIE
ncbi:MAG: RecX family transcriptional regulator [Acidobacteria bacterium]|nr:RecX family transcriptional regulator [Acidobacteriota bacterium]